MSSKPDVAKEPHLQSMEFTAPGGVLATDTGQRIVETKISLKAGERGPTLIEDFHLREKVTHFDHERIPERVVHARGAGAHGYFELLQSCEDITKARFLTDTTLKTPVFVRFSTVAGPRGSNDTVRDVRGFATKFYTPDGNQDIVGNNIPVFFIQDALQFPDLVHALKAEPHNEIPTGATAHDNAWDFISRTPQAAHMALWVLSDRALPRSYRMMQGFGVHTFALVNAAGERRFVKFHWRPLLGVHSLAWDEAVKIAGADPDFHRRDLWDAIAAGQYPQYELGLQLVSAADEHKFEFDLLDATKLIPEELVPIRWVGRMTLNQNPREFFSEVEQVAFCTQHVVPGIDFTDDPLLQGRNFSYHDTQLSRLGGPNFNQLPINRPRGCPVLNVNRDGLAQHRIVAGTVNYFPNRFELPQQASPATGYVAFAERFAAIKERVHGAKFQEHFAQASMFWRSLSGPEQDHLVAAARFELSHCDSQVVHTEMLALINRVDHQLAVRIAEGLGTTAPAAVPPPTSSVHSSAFLSQLHPAYRTPTGKPTVATRRVAILVADGFSGTQVKAVSDALKAAHALPFLVGPRKGPVRAFDTPHDSFVAQFTHFNCKSVLFDAVYVPGGAGSVAKLAAMGDSVAFVQEAFKHCKPLAVSGEAVEFVRSKCTLPAALRLAAAGDTAVVVDSGVVSTGSGFLAQQFIDAIAEHRFWSRDVAGVPA